MYCHGPLLRAQGGRPVEAWRALPAMLLSVKCRPRLLLAGRQPLPGLHPLQQGGFRIAYGPADPDVRGAVAAHAGLRKPREADFEKLGRFLWCNEDDGRRGRLLRQAAGERRLRGHFG